MGDWEWLRLLIPVVAVSVGFALGQWDTWRRGRREAKGARVLLRLEIDDNLAEVRRYRAEAADRALEEMLPPAWQKEAWASQLARLPAALSVAELARVRGSYSRLDVLAEHDQGAGTATPDPLVRAREVGAVDELSRALERDANPPGTRRDPPPGLRVLLLRARSGLGGKRSSVSRLPMPTDHRHPRSTRTETGD